MNVRTRRDFLKASGTFGAAAVAASILPRAAWANAMGLPIGIQLYTVRGVIGKDTPGTLKALYDIGYREVETAGGGSFSPVEFGKMIKDAGLKCPSAHLQLNTPDLSKAFDEAHALGVTYATSSALWAARPAPGQKMQLTEPNGLDRFKKLAEQMNDIGKQAKAAGLRYAYHNHNPEFVKMPDGSYGYDVLLKETDPETVFFEIDCGWMTVAGASPVEYMKRYPHRFKMLHIKDFKPIPQATTTLAAASRPQGTEVGTGFVDYKPIFVQGKKSGIEHVFTEQEGPYTKPELESAKIDYDYLHAAS
jgi:sugar phosphate isomerase/epimerase